MCDCAGSEGRRDGRRTEMYRIETTMRATVRPRILTRRFEGMVEALQRSQGHHYPIGLRDEESQKAIGVVLNKKKKKRAVQDQESGKAKRM